LTLSVRNGFFRGGIILAALSVGLIAIGGRFAFSAYPTALESSSFRSWGIIQKFIEGFAEPLAVIPFLTMLSAAVFSLISIILIYYFFEKTLSPEIFFFGCFIISLSFEIARLIIPLQAVFPFSSMYLITAARILLFGRFLGLFSLFAVSIYAAGLDAQKQLNIFFMMTVAALIIALNIPVDSLVWDSSLKMLNVYKTMFTIVEITILVITVITFFVSAYSRSSRNYITIGIGIFLAVAGRNILLASDTWITPITGLLFLFIGAWLVCSRLHRIYLWL